MGDVGDMWREVVQTRRIQRKRALDLAKQKPEGWTVHTEYHWSRTFQGERLDYWPSKGKWRWKGKTMTGRVDEFINARTKNTPPLHSF